MATISRQPITTRGVELDPIGSSQSDGRSAAALLSVSDLASRVATRPWSVIEGPVADFVSDNASWGG